MHLSSIFILFLLTTSYQLTSVPTAQQTANDRTTFSELFGNYGTFSTKEKVNITTSPNQTNAYLDKNTPAEQTATYEDYVNLLQMLTGFNSRVRPVVNQSAVVTVYVDFHINSLLAVHESTQTIGECTVIYFYIVL